MFLGAFQGAAALAAGVSLAYILQEGNWTGVSTPDRHYISMYFTTRDWHKDSLQHSALDLSE